MSDPVETHNAIAQAYATAFGEPSAHIGLFVRALHVGASVLDLGCGPGVDAAYLTQQGFQVHGVDAALKMIELAQKRAPLASFESADMRTADYGKEKYDGIVASFSLNFLPKRDIEPLWAKLVQALKPSGFLFLCLQSGYAQEIELPEPFDPKLTLFVNVFSKEEVQSLCDKYGLVICELKEADPDEKAGELDFTKYVALIQKK